MASWDIRKDGIVLHSCWLHKQEAHWFGARLLVCFASFSICPNGLRNLQKLVWGMDLDGSVQHE